MGEISECIMIVPSNGRSGVGLIIFAETWAKTLREHEVNNMYHRRIDTPCLA